MIRTACCVLSLVAPLSAQGPPHHLGEGDLDWLVHEGPWSARVEVLEGGRLVLTNGLVQRVIATDPDGATLAIDELSSGRSLLRAVKPEAELVLDGVVLPVGGLTGQPDHAFLLPEWEAQLTRDEGALHLLDWEIGTPQAFHGWKRVRHAQDRPWPPAGVRLSMRYRTAARAPVTVTVHHELLDGVPAFSKWIEVTNDGAQPLTLERFTCERLAFVEDESRVDAASGFGLPDVLALTDMSFGGMSLAGSNVAVRWGPDPEYKTQVNYARKTPCLLEVSPPLGPAVTIAPGGTLRSFKSHLLVFDSTDRERQGLATRALLRTLAPWLTENPIQMHVRSADPAAVRLAVDQCVEVGFELDGFHGFTHALVFPWAATAAMAAATSSGSPR